MTEQRPRIKVGGFDEWTDSFKSEVVFKRPEGDVVITINAISDSDRMEISEVHKELSPPRPRLVLDKRTGEPVINKVNQSADLEYEKKKNFAYRVLQMLYIEKGCAWNIPGKNNEEKLAALGKKVAGEVDRLHTAILALSRLTNDDIDFF